MRNPFLRALSRAWIPVLLWPLTLVLPPTRTAQRKRRRTLWPATAGVYIAHRNIHAVGSAR
ncbi:hypothetical protein [Streptomyces sp. NRRL B-24572]|uniref:hypothetical protein n=1 Tax=Streptomyces sp. NRRL B-24572 TaxID=1962156 RepID=UPI000A3C3B90|nr:hypothetical protein [Streptomyces sp. NRRL B-24572]